MVEEGLSGGQAQLIMDIAIRMTVVTTRMTAVITRMTVVITRMIVGTTEMVVALEAILAQNRGAGHTRIGPEQTRGPGA
jgi:hypothetical protein